MNQITKIKGKNIMKRTLFISALLATSLTGTAQAVEGVKPCREIQWQQYEVYAIKSSLHQRTHIILPEPIQGSPVPGNPQLWDVDGENIHLFVKPKNYGNNEGGKTTVTAISTTNTSYDFVVSRVENNPDTCIRIVQDKGVSGVKQGWKTQVERDNAYLKMQLSQLNQKLSTEQGQLTDRVIQGINKYKASVYTGYKWTGSGGFLGKDSVSDVWDDGRFTYIRLRNSAKGLMQITAKIEGNEEAVDYKYDVNTKLYTISGLFAEFVMAYEDNKLIVKREDNKS